MTITVEIKEITNYGTYNFYIDKIIETKNARLMWYHTPSYEGVFP